MTGLLILGDLRITLEFKVFLMGPTKKVFHDLMRHENPRRDGEEWGSKCKIHDARYDIPVAFIHFLLENKRKDILLKWSNTAKEWYHIIGVAYHRKDKELKEISLQKFAEFNLSITDLLNLTYRGETGKQY